jgi:hypothetical protein
MYFFIVDLCFIILDCLINISYLLVDLGEGAVALRAYVPNEQSWVSLLHLVIDC